jgi:hypothetical protein
MKWAKCLQCGGEVWFDAWVCLNGDVAGGPYSNTWCSTCGGEADYCVVTEDEEETNVND